MGSSFLFDLLGVRYGLFPCTDLFYQIFFAANLSFFTTFLGALLAVLINRKPVRKMLPAMAWYWIFVMSWIPINLACLVKKSTVWEAIPHTKAIRLFQLKQADPGFQATIHG